MTDIFYNSLQWCLYSSANILKTTELCIFKQVNRMLSELFLKYLLLTTTPEPSWGRLAQETVPEETSCSLTEEPGVRPSSRLLSPLPVDFRHSQPGHLLLPTDGHHQLVDGTQFHVVQSGTATRRPSSLNSHVQCHPIKLIFKISYPNKPKMPSYHIRGGAFTF